jgi:hypothetical protein
MSTVPNTPAYTVHVNEFGELGVEESRVLDVWQSARVHNLHILRPIHDLLQLLPFGRFPLTSTRRRS